MRRAEDIPLYPIGTASRITGISDKTLRAWEVRYELLKPARTSGGHRLFSKNDLYRIERIKHMLRDEGMSMTGVKHLIDTEES